MYRCANKSANNGDPDRDKDLDQFEYVKFVKSYVKEEFAKLGLTKVAIKRLPPGYKEAEVLKLLSPLPPHNYLHFYRPPKLAEFHFNTRPSLRINFKNPADAEWFIEKYNGFTICDARGNEYKAITEYCSNQKLPDFTADEFEKDELHGTWNPEEDTELIEELNTIGTSEISLISVNGKVKELEERVTNQSSDKTKITPLIEIIQRGQESKEAKIAPSPVLHDSKSSSTDEVSGGDKVLSGGGGCDERKPKSKGKERRDRARRERRKRERAERYARERAEREKTPPKMVKRNRETEGNEGECVEPKNVTEIPIRKKEENLKVESKATTATPLGDPKRRDAQRNRGGRNYEDRDRRGRNYDEREDTRGGRRNSGQSKFNNGSSNSNQEKKEKSAQSSETKPDSNSKTEVKPGVASDEHKSMNEPPKKIFKTRYYTRNRTTREENEDPQEPSTSTNRSKRKEGTESGHPKKVQRNMQS